MKIVQMIQKVVDFFFKNKNGIIKIENEILLEPSAASNLFLLFQEPEPKPKQSEVKQPEVKHRPKLKQASTENPGAQYLETLKSLYDYGCITFVSRNEHLENRSTPGCRAIGWVCRGELWIDPNSAWEEVLKCHDNWVYSRVEVYRKLDEEGFLRRRAGIDGRLNSTQRRDIGLDKKQKRVLVLDSDIFSL
jgi:hypothetical protein